MNVVALECSESSAVSLRLADVVNYDVDLPDNVFVSDDFEYWFFDRPLMSYSDIAERLIVSSFQSYGCGVYLKSGLEAGRGQVFFASSDAISTDSALATSCLAHVFEEKLEYPMYLFSESLSWVAVESMYEEIGVVAVRNDVGSGAFKKILDEMLMSRVYMQDLALKGVFESKIAQAFLQSY